MSTNKREQAEIAREIIYSETLQRLLCSMEIREQAEISRWLSKQERRYSNYLTRQAQDILQTVTLRKALMKVSSIAVLCAAILTSRHNAKEAVTKLSFNSNRK
ncbi:MULTISPECIES: hypothetical protein [Fischerella]|uniref:Uncharacterized protein n=1 Tax=Fischerella muscicola CCMEE 5323 TaxID=2019572 RepID=A0A2N6K2X2_FISMU|nr:MULTISPECIES: hypothetical protein [Fischerella]MBD2434462.1 hypothetical protein [Fischerella sp. FACHB-380]PLZ89563.1 hypothetical protein CEN44_12800 [Fischerella muscicola CCMEE 5323]